jgi:hypothetical protein
MIKVISKKRSYEEMKDDGMKDDDIKNTDKDNNNFKEQKIIEKDIENYLKLKDLLECSKRKHSIEILNEKTLKDVHIYCKKNKLSGQISGPLIENYIIKKYGMKKNKSSLCNGDGRCSETNYEIKISLGGNKTNKSFNYVQIRLNHDIDYYIFTAYYLSEGNLIEFGELFTFLLNKDDMKKMISKYGMYAHGTKKEYGEIKMEDLEGKNNMKEYALRPKYDDECWNELLKYKFDIDKYFIKN